MNPVVPIPLGVGNLSTRRVLRSRAVLMAVLTCFAAGPPLMSVTYTWLPTGGSHDWTNALNWSPTGVPDGPTDTVNLTADLATDQVIYLNSNITVGGMNVGDPNTPFGTYTLSPGTGGSLTLTNGTGQVVWYKSLGAGTPDVINATIVLGSDLLISNGSFCQMNFSGVVSEIGSRKVTLVGDATSQTVFYQTNTFTGGFTLHGGKLVAGASSGGTPGNPTSGPFGAGTQPVILNGGEIRSIIAQSNTVGNRFIFASNFGCTTWSGEKSLILSGPVTLSNGNRTLQVDVGSTVADAALILSGTVSDDGMGWGLIKTGPGTLHLAGSNDYSGGTLVSAGNLVLSNKYAIGTNGLTNNGQVTISLVNAGGVTSVVGFSNVLAGTGTNWVMPPCMGTGSTEIWLDGDFSGFTGTWFVGPGAPAGSGKLRVKGADNSAATFHVLTNATLWVNGNTHQANVHLYGGDTGESFGQLRVDGNANQAGPVFIAGSMTGAGDGHLGASTGNGTVSGPVSEVGGSNWGVLRCGTQMMTLSGTNTFSGPFVLLGGGLTASAPSTASGTGPFGSNALVVLANSNSTYIQLATNVSMGGMSGGGNTGGWVYLSNFSLTVGTSDGSVPNFSGLIIGGGKLIKTGTNNQVLTGTNTYSGGTELSNGLLQVGQGSCLGSGLVNISTNANRLMLTNGSVLTNALVINRPMNEVGRGAIEIFINGNAFVSNNVVTLTNGTVRGGTFAGWWNGTLHLFSSVNAAGGSIVSRMGTVVYYGGGIGNGFMNFSEGRVRLGSHQGLPTNQAVVMGTTDAGLNWTNLAQLDLAGWNQSLLRVYSSGATNHVTKVGNGSATVDAALTLFGGGTNSVIFEDGTNGMGLRLSLVFPCSNADLSATNTYSGPTVVAGGTLSAGVSGVPGLGGPFGSNSAMVLSNAPAVLLSLNGFACEVGSLSGGGAAGGNVDLGPGSLAIGTAHSNSTFDGVISGTGGIVKTGNGSLTLTGDHTFTGETLVTNGSLVLTGSLAGTGTAVVSNGGTLCGTGTAQGSVTVGMGGLLAPGLPGTNAAGFTAGSLVFQDGAKYAVDLDGSGPTNDRVTVAGTAVCGGNLVATNVTNSTNGCFYTVLRASNVMGTFSGIPDNGFLYQKGRLFQVRYTATNVTLRDIGNLAPPPGLEVTNPAPLGFWNGVGPVAGVSTNLDPSLASPSVYAMTNGGAWVFLGVTNAWTFAHGASNLGDGTNVFSFRAWLSNGVTNQVWHTNILDRTPPGLVQWTAVTNPFITRTSVVLSASDDFALDRIFYTTDGSAPDTNAPWVSSGAPVTLTNACTLTAVARDMAGHWGPTNSLVFTMVANPSGGGSIGAVAPNPYRPGNGVLTVSFQRQNLDRVGMLLFDIQGRQVVELNAVSDSALYRVDFMWDGKMASGQVAGRGMYLLIPRVAGVVRSDLARRLYLP